MTVGGLRAPRVVIAGAAVAAVVVVAAGCTHPSHEDDAYDLAKAQAKSDLGCSDVTVRKMGQLDDNYEYQAKGCDDVYSYGVECDGGCRIAAGVRGPGLAGTWHKAGSIIDRAMDSWDEMDRRQQKMHEDNEAFRRDVEARQRKVWDMVDHKLAQPAPEEPAR